MVRVRISPIINAQNELDQWWLQHLDKYARPHEGVYIFIDETHKLHYELEYIEKINQITAKFGLKDKQLVKSSFDNYEIKLPQEPEPEPETEPEIKEIGISIDDIQHELPSEETKEPEPVLNYEFNPRVAELQYLIFSLNEKLSNYRSELNGLLFRG